MWIQVTCNTYKFDNVVFYGKIFIKRPKTGLCHLCLYNPLPYYKLQQGFAFQGSYGATLISSLLPFWPFYDIWVCLLMSVCIFFYVLNSKDSCAICAMTIKLFFNSLMQLVPINSQLLLAILFLFSGFTFAVKYVWCVFLAALWISI